MKRVVLLIMLFISASRVGAVVLPSEITTDQTYGDTVEVTSVVFIKGAKVTFLPGTVFKMNDGCKIYVKYTSEVHFNGTESDSIRFISAAGHTEIPAIFINGVDTSTISYCKFDSFKSIAMGISNSENVVVEHSTFSNNPQALQFYESSGSINSCDFIDNIALNKTYSALQITKSSNVSIRNTTFKGNGSEVASAIDVNNSSLIVENSVIENNSATLSGGAIRFVSETDDSLKIYHTSVTNNSGGGVYTNSPNISTNQLTVSGNSIYNKNFSSEDEVWQDSVKFVTEDYIILPSSNITVKAGAILFSEEYLTLDVFGNLSLVGTVSDSIYIKGQLKGINYHPLTSGETVIIKYTKVYGMYKGERAGIEVSNRKKLEVSNSLFQNNLGTYGGALYINETEASITDCDFTKNEARSDKASYGAAIYALNSNLTIASTNFSLNHISTGSGIGGDIYSNGGKVTITNSLFHRSYIDAGYALGGSMAIYNGKLHISDSKMYRNQAFGDTEGNGSAIYAEDSDLFINQVDFDSTYSSGMNSAASGALSLKNCNMEIDKSNFSGNRTSSTRYTHGGAVYKMGVGSTKITNSTFKENNASKHLTTGGGAYGGALCIKDDLTIIKNCSFEDNYLSVSSKSKANSSQSALGGAVFISSSSFLVDGSLFNNNSAKVKDYDSRAYAEGGALYLNGNGTVNRCTISNNSAVTTSEMISTYYSTVSSTGGAIRASHSKVSINNTLFFDNWVSAESFQPDYPTGGTLSSDSTLLVRNCTIGGTTKGDNAISAHIEAYNTIFDIRIPVLSVGSEQTSKIYNSVFTQDNDFVSINENIKVDPLFIDSANGNYALQATSPLINIGDNSTIYGSADINGNARIMGSSVDIGAFEYGATAIDIANDVKANTIQDIAVTIALSSQDGATIFKQFTAPKGGNVKIVGSTLTYTPFENFSGVDYLTYYPVTSTGITGAQATVSITVLNLNDAPVAIGGIVEIMKNSAPAEFDMTGTDFEGGNITDYIIVDSTIEGRYTVSNRRKISYIPNLDFVGVDSLTYKVVDDSGAYSELATIKFIVRDSIVTAIKDGIFEKNSNEIVIYPNPAITTANIRTSLTGDRFVYNRNGNKLFKAKGSSFDASKLKKGIYYISIEDNKDVKAVKSFYKR